jgi:hypothetical protein
MRRPIRRSAGELMTVSDAWDLAVFEVCLIREWRPKALMVISVPRVVTVVSNVP